MKTNALTVLAVLLLVLAGCSSSTTKREVANGAACKGLELDLIQTSLVFEDTLSGVGNASNKDALAFFEELNELSENALNVGNGSSGVDPRLADASGALVGAVLEVQGLISSDFAPVEVGKSIRPAVGELFSLCNNWAEIRTSPEELFAAPEIVTFDLNLYDSVYDEPSLELLSAVGFPWDECDFTFGPNIEDSGTLGDSPLNNLKPFIQSLCSDGDSSLVIVRRFESNLESLNAAKIAKELDPEGGVTILFSDQFNVLLYSDDTSKLENANGWIYLLDGFEVYGR